MPSTTPPTPVGPVSGPPHAPTADRDQAIAHWEKHRAKGRTDFIVRRGVLGWGLPAAVLTIFYKVVKEQGFVATPQLTQGLRTAIVVALVIFPLCGWLFGRWLWTTGEARYTALTGTRGEGSGD